MDETATLSTTPITETTNSKDIETDETAEGTLPPSELNGEPEDANQSSADDHQTGEPDEASELSSDEQAVATEHTLTTSEGNLDKWPT